MDTPDNFNIGSSYSLDGGKTWISGEPPEREIMPTPENKNERIVYILTWLTGEKTILTNSFNRGEIDPSQFSMRINNAIARCVTEIKELL